MNDSKSTPLELSNNASAISPNELERREAPQSNHRHAKRDDKLFSYGMVICITIVCTAIVGSVISSLRPSSYVPYEHFCLFIRNSVKPPVLNREITQRCY